MPLLCCDEKHGGLICLCGARGHTWFHRLVWRLVDWWGR